MRRARRGVVFLLAALLLVSVLLTVLFVWRKAPADERQAGVAARIATMDDFLRDFHSDVHRATYISGFRALIAVEEKIGADGEYLANASPAFAEAFLNGTIGSEPYDVMANSTFSDYLARVNARASDVGVVLDVSVLDITLDQSNPWSVDVTFSLAVNLSDARGLARWDYEREFTTQVPITDLRDPVYSVETAGRLPNTFRISPYNDSDFVAGNDTTGLNSEALEMYYREDPHAPSFLQRLAGNLTGSSKYGIASLVDLDDLDAQGITVRAYRPTIDYLYFSNATATTYCPSFGSPLPAWLRIDSAHMSDPAHDYGFAELNATVC